MRILPFKNIQDKGVTHELPHQIITRSEKKGKWTQLGRRLDVITQNITRSEKWPYTQLRRFGAYESLARNINQIKSFF